MDVLVAAPPRPSATDIIDMRWRREFEEMVLPLTRDFIETGKDWKSRIRTVRALYRGDWEVAYPDGTVRTDLPKTANPVQTGLDDLSHLAVENEAQHHCTPTDTDSPAILNAELRSHVLDSYWYFNEGEYMAPQLIFDLAGTGGCFVSVTAKDGFDYPCFTRLDPDNSYPDVVNGVMVTFLYVQRMPIRHAHALYGVDYSGVADTTEVEIVDYYDSSRHMRGSTGLNSQSEFVKGSARVLNYTQHDLGCTPIGWGKLPTLDGAWRGIFDQAGGGMLARNRILQLTLDYADQLVYAPMFAHDVENDRDPPSPRTLYRLRTAEGKIGRVAPAGTNPELFQLMEYLDREGGRGTMTPAARAGEVHQSIASAAFVTSTLGQLTSVIRVLQRELGMMRQRANYAGMKLDETYLDFNKPLVINAGRRDTYTPSTAIAHRYEHRVLYGAGAGLDALNKKVAILQDLGARLISRDTARDQLDYVGDKVSEALKVDREMVADALSQRLATENDLSVLMNMLRLMLQGQDFAQASGVMAPMVEQNMLQQMAGAVGAQGGLPSGAGPGGPPSAAQQQLALAAGATGPPQGVGGPGVPAGGPTQPVQFPAPPMEQVMVRPVGGQ
jgi:hypothetical protein